MGSAVVVAIGIGVAIAAQVTVVGQASRAASPLLISFGLQLAGAGVAAIWTALQGDWNELWASAGWWWVPIGALGWAIVGALGFSASRLGASTSLALVVAAQLLAALGLDRATDQLDVHPRHLLGVILLVAGVILISARS